MSTIYTPIDTTRDKALFKNQRVRRQAPQKKGAKSGGRSSPRRKGG